MLSATCNLQGSKEALENVPALWFSLLLFFLLPGKGNKERKRYCLPGRSRVDPTSTGEFLPWGGDAVCEVGNHMSLGLTFLTWLILMRSFYQTGVRGLAVISPQITVLLLIAVQFL